MDPTATRLRAVGCCAVSDALDTLGLPGAVTGVGPLSSLGGPVAGRVRTVLAGPREETGPARHIATEAVVAAEEGELLVIANGGRTDVSCWGGILTSAASRRGVAGVLVDGALRDVAESEAAGLPVFGRAVVPVSARGRIVQRAMDVPVTFAGVEVAPRALVVADRDGVVFVAPEHLAAVLSLAERIAAREALMVEAIAAGDPVTEVMHDSRFPAVTADPRPSTEPSVAPGTPGAREGR
ncbi:RraA family protein [Streptomyces profundus]|uniref:RraA family protein n=1 Tax=Streptomyces profundus TaxID=2867410 RepID=UPI001D16ED48|nr:4-carboxy-4-hydroxy-2-oxoadipate aldolase/oxaloacetate decarboxylase [Streptomyces sp. MA3_2.13]UED83247.1 4-carboxy-4-hydroxy-2-oxoadipate aldolase/oxaloacetate decarboxylase [Streptomyces sp. MA3_2.13]